MSLEVAEYWEDVSFRNRVMAKTFCPPFTKWCIYFHVVLFFRARPLCKCITDVATKSDIVECSDDSPCKSMNGLFDACSVSLG